MSSLSTIVPTLFAVWYAQGSRKDSAKPEFPATDTAAVAQGNNQAKHAAEDPDQSTRARTIAVLIPSGLGEGVNIDLATLTDVRQTVQALQTNVAVLRGQVLSAVVAHGPAKDWRILLAEPRWLLDSINMLLDQLGQTQTRWVHTGAWSFAFTDTLAAARRAAASLGEAIEERTAERPARTNLVDAITQIVHVVSELAELLNSAVPNP